MNAKTRFPRRVAECVAAELLMALEPACARIAIAGSLRRQKPDVGDIEILYIPRHADRADPHDMFRTISVNLATETIARMERDGILERRLNAKGREMFGMLNKFMVHVATGIPVDLFEASPANWFNYCVCRTGSADTNRRIAQAAIERGWTWNPYGSGFSRPVPGRHEIERHKVTSEEGVFAFVGLPCPLPVDR